MKEEILLEIINAFYKDKELNGNTTCVIFAQVEQEGIHKVKRSYILIWLFL